MLSFTSLAVNGDPSEQVTPGTMVNATLSPATFQLLARPETNFPSELWQTSVS